MTPYGWQLCRDMCDSLTTCSSPGYQEEALTCVLSNRSSGFGKGERKCRNLTSRRGDRVTVCSTEKAVEFVHPLADITVRVNEDIHLVCEVSKSDLKPEWTFNGVVIVTSQTVTMISDGNVHQLHITTSSPDDKGVYKVSFGEVFSEANVLVEDEPIVFFVRPLTDAMVRENEDIYLECEVSKPALKPKWTVDEGTLAATSSVIYTSEGNVHKLHIRNAEEMDTGVYKVSFGDHSCEAKVVVFSVSGIQGGNREQRPKFDLGCPVLLSNNLYGILVAIQQVIYVDNHIVNCMYLDNNLRIKSIMTYKQGNVRVNNKIIVWRTASSVNCGIRLENYGNIDFVVYCFTGMTLKKAQLNGFDVVS